MIRLIIYKYLNIFTFCFCFVFVFIASFFFSCERVEDNSYIQLIDSLNTKAYSFHYISLDSVEKYANEALCLENEHNYSDGKYEALCNLAFTKYMRLDYLPSQTILEDVRNNTDNELYKLVADVLMMRICQRRSENKDFFVYSNEAQDCMKRVETDQELLNIRQRVLWNYAVSEFHFANSVYNYYIRQEQKENEDLEYVRNNFYLVENDTAQEAMLYYLIGNIRAVDKERPVKNVKYLIDAASLAHNYNIKYILAKSLSSIAEDLSKSNNYSAEDVLYLKQHVLNVNYPVANDSLPLVIANIALREFKDYGSLFDVSQTYIAIANYYISTQNGDSALVNMERALNCVNEHHRLVSDDAIVLKTEFDPNFKDSLSIEQRWIREGVVCVPEWMADVREHLSIVYALLGSKENCYFNRNVYLDIIEETRQDNIMAQVYNNLKKEQSDLKKYLNFSFLILLSLMAGAYFGARHFRRRFTKNYLKERKAVELEMKRWREKTDEDFSSLEEKQEMLTAERISKERKLVEQKRQYINKTTCLSIVYAITPFLDRAVNEVKKIKSEIERITDSNDNSDNVTHRNTLLNEKLVYLNELIERINLYNDILANWIKIRQGEVALNVEKFELQPLFDIMRKNNRVFLSKNISLVVENTDAIVKADRALTLFMINTLLDNARKYSSSGGFVKLYAEEKDDYVDIAVEDTGKGMTEQDVNTIMQEKVYDSSKIGDVEHDDELKNNKGFGFGLLNCKGIIEKYKKTSDIFKICKFGVVSELGKGSKFFFRLPKVGLRNLCFIALFICNVFLSFAQDTLKVTYDDFVEMNDSDSMPIDDVHAKARNFPNHPDIMEANRFATLAYDCNLNEEWDNTLMYVDSACMKLNDYYKKKVRSPKYFIKLYDEDKMPDIDLWNSGFYTDYHTILDIRNEAAIAALAVNDYDLYYYNNEIFNRLYKLMNADPMLEQRCDATRNTMNNYKTLSVVVLVFVILGMIVFFFIYYHNYIMPVFSLRQILELNRSIFNNNDESQLANIIYHGIYDIRRVDGVEVMVGQGQVLVSDLCPKQEYLIPILKDAYTNKDNYILDKGKTRIYPLLLENDLCIGSIAFLLHNENTNKEDDKLFKMIADYTAVNIYYSTVRINKLNDNIEIIEDDKRRTEREENIVHVQNMVIDNTLSTIKHETMYYPNRIRQIVDKMSDNLKNEDNDHNLEYVNNMYELITYYKEIFTILGDCAAKQIVRPMFRRKNIILANVVSITERVVNKYNKKNNADIKLDMSGIDVAFAENNQVIADDTMLGYLIENVVYAILNDKIHGSLFFDLDKSDDFIKFVFNFAGNNMTKDKLKTMFYPEALEYDSQTDTLKGAQMLLAKQIVREHDEHVKRGCRIYAGYLSDDENGLSVVFTIPSVIRPNIY